MKIIFTDFSRGNVLHRSKGQLENIENSVAHYTLHIRLHFFSIDDRLCVERKDGRSYASVNSSSALPTRALVFKKKNGQIPRGALMPRGEHEERGQMPRPWYRLPTPLQIFINQWIKWSTVHYVNTMVETSRTTVCVSWFSLYCIIFYILFLTLNKKIACH